MRENSRNYGSFRWYYNSNAVQDENANDFVAQALGPIWLHYREKFSTDFQYEMSNHMHAVLRALYRQEIAIGYTNIYLRRAVSQILIGESLSLPGAVHAGGQALARWLAYTQASGIHEYDSPTYYSVDLNSLVMGYLYVKAPWLHQTLKAALDLFWTDIKANYFPGRQDLSGAHSRDYDFATGQGGILYYLWTEGKCSWYRTDASRVEMEQVFILENGVSPRGYHPDWEALPSVSDNLPKWVVQTNDTTANADRVNWITPDFALGSASANYSAQDKLINLELAAPRSGFPAITIVPDRYDAPYGQSIPDSLGHLKPEHLPLNPASVQKAGMLLTVLDLDPVEAGTVSSLATNILLPAKADWILVDGQRVNLSGPTQIPVGTNSWIGLREEQTAVLIRMFWVDPLNNVLPKLVLQSDSTGLRSEIARLTAYHYQGNAPTTFAAAHLRVGVIIVAYHCGSDAEWNALQADARNSRITTFESNGMLQVQAQLSGPEGGFLQILRSLDNRETFTRVRGGS
jgi:hypothetical protein